MFCYFLLYIQLRCISKFLTLALIFSSYREKLVESCQIELPQNELDEIFRKLYSIKNISVRFMWTWFLSSKAKMIIGLSRHWFSQG